MLKFMMKYLLLVTLVVTPGMNMGKVYASKDSWCKKQRVAIIGGGMAGVATAAFLSNSDCEVYLIESETELGGHAQTKILDNGAGSQVEVDLGAQNFTEGPWDLYTDFLKLWGLYNKRDLFTFSPSATISKSGEKPHFVTPQLTRKKLAFLLRDSRWSYLFSLYNANKKAHKLYKSTAIDYSGTVNDLLQDMNLNQRDQNEVFLPFLASTIGIDVDQSRNLSALATAQLFAFNPPLTKTRLHVFKRGMGSVIRELGGELERECSNINILRDSYVQNVTQADNGYVVRHTMDGKGQELRVNKIITTVNAPQLAQMLKNTVPGDNSLFSHLNSLPFTRNRVVLHTNDIFDKGKLSSFINFEYNDQGKTFMTMQLSEIDKMHYGNIRKSWVNDDEVYSRLKESNTILAEGDFLHPFVTPEFVEHRDAMKEILETNEQYKDIGIAGGWTELVATQATAILSAYKEVNRLFPDLMKEKCWGRVLPSLRPLVNR